MSKDVSSALLRKRVRAGKELPSPAERRAIRIAARLSVTELADMIKVSRNSIYLWETTDRAPQGEHLVRYVEALRIMREDWCMNGQRA